jgi:hypothetical protein
VIIFVSTPIFRISIYSLFIWHIAGPQTCGAGTITHLHDVTVGTVGPPVACCHIRLVDVPEMGYRHADRDEHTGQVPGGVGCHFTRPGKNIFRQSEIFSHTCLDFSARKNETKIFLLF